MGMLAISTAGPTSAQGYAEGFGAYDSGNYQRAYDIWLKLAEQGDRDAQYSLGKLLETGGGPVAKDYEQAAAWYERAAVQGVAHAQNNLGLMLAQGRGVPRDPHRAAELWRAAAQQDHAIAQFNLGLAYFRGEGVSEDKPKAETWFRRAAELGLPDAQYALGQVRRLGLTGAPADESEALNWYQLAAAQGHEKAASEAAALRAKGVSPKAVAPTAPPAAPEPATAEMPGETVPAPAAEMPGEAAPEVAEAEMPSEAAPEAPEAEVPGEAASEMAAAADASPVEAESASEADARGGFQIWLRSERDAEAANAALAEAQARHPEIFADASGAVVAVKLGEGGVFHRVVADGLASDAAAALCRDLRAADPQAFCKVQASN